MDAYKLEKETSHHNTSHARAFCDTDNGSNEIVPIFIKDKHGVDWTVLWSREENKPVDVSGMCWQEARELTSEELAACLAAIGATE